MTDKPVSVINEPKNLLELVVCPSDRQYDLDISSIAPQCKTLSKKQLINYIESLPDKFVFIQWDYPNNERYKMIEALFDGRVE